jgi:Putative zinc-finger
MRVRPTFTFNGHLTDHDLLRGVDGELTGLRQAAVDRHLAECETCRDRRVALEEMATAVSIAYATTWRSSPGTHERSRARLKIGLAQAAQEPARWWHVDAREGAKTLRRASGYAAAVAVVAMVAWLSVSAAPDGASLTSLADQQPPLPVASMTPGATWDVTAEDLCAGTRHTRTISPAMRAQVLSAYGMEHVPPDQYELDYLITPELGGATDARNLWPQAYASPVWNARVKDELERLLPQLVCSQRLDLQSAQRDMAVDWIAAYKKYFNTDRPLQAHRGLAGDDDDDEVYAAADARPAPAVRLVSLAVLR